MYQEIAFIALMTVLQTLFLMYLHKLTLGVVHTSLLALKKEIADAINSIIGENGSIEQAQSVTPMQMFIMDYIKENLKAGKPNVDVLRNSDGTFGV